MRSLRCRPLVAILCFAAIVFGGGFASADEKRFAEAVLPVLRKHCVECHGQDGEVNGDVDFTQLEASRDITARPDLLAAMLRVVGDGEMPPDYAAPLGATLRSRFVADLETLLDESLKTTAAIPRTPIRRMNRFQYANAVTDLFELKVEVFELPEAVVRDRSGYFQPASGSMPYQLVAGCRPLGKSQTIAPRLNGVVSFPQDLRAEHGFDNRADLLSLSPLLMESFLSVAGSIVHSSDFTAKNCGIWNEFFAAPAEGGDVETAIRSRLRPFLTRAFRRSIDDELLDAYTRHAMACYRDGLSFTDSMKEVAAAALVSPRFLYLFDGRSTTDQAEPLDDFELASRLSFFLWGSIPDQTLLDLAASQSLGDRRVLAAQVDRMLKDRRLKRFCDAFPAQWLQLEHIVASVPDPEMFPNFYTTGKYRASMHMMMEPLLLFEAILVENRSILELIDSEFTYRSNWLVSLYRDGSKPADEISPTAVTFDRVPITDRREGGVITTAAIMTMTSTPVRTQPITRGAWVVSVIFNDPPAPPPADVPPLEEDNSSGSTKGLTLREKLLAHQTRADCAACHSKIDPYGFALENYSPIGLWRDAYDGGQPIDASGRLFNNREFSNIVEFKDALLEAKDRFARAFAAHLLTYALGRELKAADQRELDKIVAQAAAGDYRLRPLIREVVLSKPFLTKFNPPIRAVAQAAPPQNDRTDR